MGPKRITFAHLVAEPYLKWTPKNTLLALRVKVTRNSVFEKVTCIRRSLFLPNMTVTHTFHLLFQNTFSLQLSSKRPSLPLRCATGTSCGRSTDGSSVRLRRNSSPVADCNCRSALTIAVIIYP